ncbi:MAG: type II toxin-antitoxin system VapC family toxin [Candidatus Magasanikbacteria bacterium]
MNKEEIHKFLDEHRNIYLDVMIFIYYFEENLEFLDQVTAIFEAIEQDRNKGFVSKLIFSELLVHPYKKDMNRLIVNYIDFLHNYPNLKLIPAKEEILINSASLRAQHNLSTPDAIHTASAIEAGCTGLITADQQIKCSKLDILCLEN